MTRHVHFTVEEVNKASAAHPEFHALIAGRSTISKDGIVFDAQSDDDAEWLAKMRGRALGDRETFVVVTKSKPAAAPTQPLPIRRSYTERELLEPIARALGVDLDAPLPTPYEDLEKGLHAFCKANGIARVWNEGYAKFIATPEGRRLQDAYDADPRVPDPEVPPAAVEAQKQAGAMQALEAGLDAYCSANGIAKSQRWTVGLERFQATEQGARLKAAVDGRSE